MSLTVFLLHQSFPLTGILPSLLHMPQYGVFMYRAPDPPHQFGHHGLLEWYNLHRAHHAVTTSQTLVTSSVRPLCTCMPLQHRAHHVFLTETARLVGIKTECQGDAICRCASCLDKRSTTKKQESSWTCERPMLHTSTAPSRAPNRTWWKCERLYFTTSRD